VQGVLALAVDMTEQTQTMQALHATRHTLLAQFEASQRALARELHDRVIQPLLGFTYQLTTLQQQLDVTETPDTVHTPTLTAFRGLHTSTIEIITTIRTLISELRIPGAEELNVVLAIEEFVSYLDGVASEPHPIIALELPEQEIRLPPSIAQCLFRVAQEGIRNALRHAQASSINVTLRMIETQIMLQIRDDGQGFVAPHPLNRLVQTNSFGLVGIAERVADVGGVFTITSAPGQGATLQIQIDVPESERAYGDSHSYSPGG
jgi:signal transduction histidine kinase